MSTFSNDDLASEKQVVARQSTFVSIVLNVILATLQVVVGVIAHSQALIADGVHSLSDLVSDFVVLLANRHSGAKPDADHNYGHSRYETVASFFLGAILIAVGVGMLWRAGDRLVHLEDIPPVHASALAVAVVVLLSKEGLFRYMLREAQRVRSAMLVANAWHARSDAASSLVVAIGIIGSLAAVRLLAPLGAALGGGKVARMGGAFGWDALQDLSDRALDESASAEIRALIVSTPGVRDVHDLRTRKMGDSALVDAHILVDPMMSVSEGHYIAEAARSRALTPRRVRDALIHLAPPPPLAPRPSQRAVSNHRSAPGAACTRAGGHSHSSAAASSSVAVIASEIASRPRYRSVPLAICVMRDSRTGTPQSSVRSATLPARFASARRRASRRTSSAS